MIRTQIGEFFHTDQELLPLQGFVFFGGGGVGGMRGGGGGGGGCMESYDYNPKPANP